MEPREDEYQQRVNSAWLSHVAKGLRGELRDDGIPDDTSDEDVVRYYRDTYAADAPEYEFTKFLDDTYKEGFKAPNPTLGEWAGGVARGFKHAAPSLARQLGEQTAAEMVGRYGRAIPKGIGRGVRVIGAPLIGGAYVARMLSQIHTGDELAKIAENMPAPDMNALQRHYFESLAPGLEAKGYTNEQIIEEVQKRVGNVVRGYTATQNDLMGDVEHTSEDVLTSGAEGVANIGLLGVGSGFFKNALMAGARRAISQKAAQAVTTTLAGRLITHAATGAALGGVAGATSGAMERGAHAAVVPGESVPGAVVEGAFGGGMAGMTAGAVLGGALGTGLDALGNKAVVDAAVNTPKAPAPLVEAAVGKAMPQPPFAVEGMAPTTLEPPVGSQAWWDQFHGIKQPEHHLQSPLGAEGAAPTTAPEIAPRFEEPGMKPVVGGEPVQPRGTAEPIEVKNPIAAPQPDAELAALRDAGEPHSISLPTEGVERVTKGIAQAGGKVEGAQVSVRPNAGGDRVVIESLKGAEHGARASKLALDRITASADEAGVPLDVTVTSQKGPHGGTIPAEKIAAWYEKQGFIRTTTSEGSISLQRPPREAAPSLTPQQVSALLEHHLGLPSSEDAATLDSFVERVSGLPESKAFEALGNIEEGRPMIVGGAEGGQPSVGMRLGGWLDAQAAAADARINQKLGRLSVGFDPSLLGDYAIKAAAKMYRLGLTAFKAIKAEMLKEHPDIPADALKEIVTRARAIIGERLQGDNVTVVKLKKLLAAAEEGRAGKDWYNETAAAVGKMFGRDADMFLRFLAATSAGKGADTNVTLALKAYGQWKLGLPFDGYIGNDKLHLERAARGEVFGDRKLQSILAALRGDENAVAIDRHVMRMLGFENAGATKGNLTDREYDFFEAILRDLARAKGVTPREFQAMLWTTSKLRKAQIAEKAGDARGTAHAGTFRPYEGILKFEHDIHQEGMTPIDWVNSRRVTLRHLANASEGVNKTRAGGGHTYNPFDFSSHEPPEGLATTLASVKIPTEKLSGAEVIEFANKWRALIDTYPGLNVGTYNLDAAGEKGLTSLDLNIVLPEAMRAKALALGKARQQRSLWDYAKGEPVDTGYKGETMGAPSDPKERGQWWRKQREAVNEILGQLGVPSRGTYQTRLELPEAAEDLAFTREQVEPMVQRPHEWAGITADLLGIPQEQVKPLVDAGKVRPISDAGLLDHVVVNKDGLVWEYVDPTPPSYNIMKLVGNLKGKKAAETLVYLEGKNILSGHDVVQNYRSQAGFARVSPLPKVIEMARRAPIARINQALVKTGGKVVKPSDFRFGRPMGVSLWIAPNGEVIQVPFHLTSADKTIKALKLKNPVRYEGPEHSELQTMLNHGYVRVQLHEQMYAADSSLPMTAPQVVALRELRRSDAGQRQFAGRLTSPSGEHQAMHDEWADARALNKYIDASRAEGDK